MEFLSTAYPMNWEKTGNQWDEDRYGFIITFDPEEEPDYRYHATWGEGPEDTSGTLEEAQKWCRDMICGWIADNVLVVPNCNVTGAEPAGGASGGRRS